MRTKIKLFYRGDWETGDEIEAEYQAWLERYNKYPGPTGFSFLARQSVGNWVRVWYYSQIDL